MERQDIFLESKIQTPASSRNFLVRERLIRQLRQAEERLIVVSAGMGYGKTVLLTQYARECPGGCAWYHLGDADNDIMAFARYMSKSVSKLNPGFTPDLTPYLTLERSADLARNLAMDFAALFRQLGGEVTLVLDDFQAIENDLIFQFLQTLLDSHPGGLRLFLCMKSAPPPFCARYLMERRALLLGADSLAFRLEETREVIREYTEPEDLEQVAQAVQSRMEGWPAGISFAILYFNQRQLPMSEEDLELACQQSYLQDYFLHELFRKLPFELQHFLTCTCVLDYLRPNVCNALAGVDNAAGQLSYLERENLFILRLSGGGRIYRYHNLFKNFLTGQLQPGQRKALLAQASDFYLKTPDKAQAAEYAIACGDGQRLQTAMEAAGPNALEQGQLDTIRRWLDALLHTGVEPGPEAILLAAKYRHRTGDTQRALELTQRILDHPASVEEYTRWETRLLWARMTREQNAISDSLAALEEIVPQLRPERTALRSLRRQAVELRMYDLIDLGQFGRALELALTDLEGSARRRDEVEHAWNQETASICYFAMGEYRQALRLYVMLRGSGHGQRVAPCIYLYLAVSGKLPQALAGLGRILEEPPEGLARHVLQDILLMRSAAERMAELTGAQISGKDRVQDLWEQGALDRRFSSQGELVPLLRRALGEEPLSAKDEDALFALESGVFLPMQDAARWLAVRRRVQRGDRDCALELCRRTRPHRAVWLEENREESGRANAFLAFLTVEEALLCPGQLTAAMARLAPYWAEHGLVCPGLDPSEQTALDELLSSRAATTEALPLGQQPQKLRVECFGRFRVLLPDGQPLNWRTRKSQELFAYLFHQRGALADRERLLDLLWPQSAPANATSLLHTSLYNIRKVLTPYGLEQLILREKKGYRMDMSLVESSREMLESGQLPEDCNGPYLEDIDGHWAEESRAKYSGDILRACKSGAEERMTRGDLAGAAALLRRAMRLEPYDEGIAAMLIRCCAGLGEVKSAMAIYNRLKDTLREDLGAEPGEEVTRVYRECLLKRLGGKT